jgi:hypothetical protein
VARHLQEALERCHGAAATRRSRERRARHRGARRSSLRDAQLRVLPRRTWLRRRVAVSDAVKMAVARLQRGISRSRAVPPATDPLGVGVRVDAAGDGPVAERTSLVGCSRISCAGRTPGRCSQTLPRGPRWPCGGAVGAGARRGAAPGHGAARWRRSPGRSGLEVAAWRTPLGSPGRPHPSAARPDPRIRCSPARGGFHGANPPPARRRREAKRGSALLKEPGHRVHRLAKKIGATLPSRSSRSCGRIAEWPGRVRFRSSGPPTLRVG